MSETTVFLEDGETQRMWAVDVEYRQERGLYGCDADGRRGVMETTRELIAYHAEPRTPKSIIDEAIDRVLRHEE